MTKVSTRDSSGCISSTMNSSIRAVARLTLHQLRHALFALAIVATAAASRAVAQDAPIGASDPRWKAVSGVFGREGEAEAGYYRVNLPRADLTVRIGDVTLSPGFELTSYVGFVPTGMDRVRAMGEVVLREDEVPPALAEMRQQGIHVTALHNHLLGETPRIMYVHVMAEGGAEDVARRLKAVFQKTGTPLGAEPPASAASGDWSAVEGILGKHAEAEGAVAEYVFPRRERLTVHGSAIKSTGLIESASEVVFQQLAGGRVACGGELFVLPTEVDPVVRALEEHGLHVTAVHNHMVDEAPRMYWIHWYATGDGATLARGVAAALTRMNGAQKSAPEQ